MSRPFIAVDVETTGLDPERHEIVQLGMVGLGDDLQELWLWSETFRPRWPERADPESMAVHGLGEEHWRDALPFDAHAADVANLLRGATLVAHNPSFDDKFLRAALRRALGPGHDRWSYRLVDTMSMALPLVRALAPGGSSSLDATCKTLGLARGRSHDALSDARAHAAVFRAVTARWKDTAPAAPPGPVGRGGTDGR